MSNLDMPMIGSDLCYQEGLEDFRMDAAPGSGRLNGALTPVFTLGHGGTNEGARQGPASASVLDRLRRSRTNSALPGYTAMQWRGAPHFQIRAEALLPVVRHRR